MASKRYVIIGGVKVGGGAPVVVQTMTTADIHDVDATLKQISEVARVGCELVRVAVPDEEAVSALAQVVKASPIPVIADIHFNHKLAILSLEAGVAALRINPGNIGARWKVEEIARAAKERSVPIRVGANSGSLPKDLLEKHNSAGPEVLVEAAMREVRILEDVGFDAIKVSVKSACPAVTVRAYEILSERCDYPLHIGLTEAGPILTGAIKSTAALIPLLKNGIGDTIRVSLTADPKYEVIAAYEILDAAGVRRRRMPDVISCPTCSRCSIDVEKIASRVQDKLAACALDIKVAVMGCPVNGPGEAKQADVGISGGRGKGIIFRRGEVVKTCDESELEEELVKEVMGLCGLGVKA